MADPTQLRRSDQRPPNGGGGARLGIIQLVMTSLQSLSLCRDDALRLAALPTLVYFGAMIYGQSAAFALMTALEGGTTQIDPALGGRLLLTGIVAVLSLSWLAVNWLRFLLLGQQAAPGLGLKLGRPHLLFLLSALALAFAALLCLSLLSLPIQLVLRGAAQIGLWAAALGIGLVAIRASLALVAVAIGQPVGLRRAWEASAGQGIVLLVAFLLVEIPFVLLVTVIGLIAGATGLAVAAPYTLLLIGCIIQIVATMAQCGVLAAAYRRLIGVRA
jgi:hypothetical protein